MKPTDGELSLLKLEQVASMGDLCNIYHVSLVSGTYGNTETRTLFASGTACGIKFTNNTVRENRQVQFVDYDAVLRLVNDIPIGMTDEIELVEKGAFLISGTFKPYSAPTVNSTIQHVTLKRQK